MLAADAASTCRLWAGERVLFGGQGHTHTLRAVRPSSPVIAPVRYRARGLKGAAACTNHRLDLCGPLRRPTRDASSVLRGRRSLPGWTPRRTPGWLPAFALRQRPAPRLRLQSHPVRAVGTAPALGAAPRTGWPPGPASACWGRRSSESARRLPVLPAVLRQQLQPMPALPRGRGRVARCRQPVPRLRQATARHRLSRASSACHHVKAKPPGGPPGGQLLTRLLASRHLHRRL
jgi:hypothetical protein